MAENQTEGYNATWIPGYTKPVDLDPYMYPAAHEKKFDTRKEWATSPQMYHNEIMNDYVTNVSKNLSEIPYVGNVLAAGAELGAPLASGIFSLPYDIGQGFGDFEKKLMENPEQYNSLGSTASGILQAIDDQNPLSTVYHRTKGALRPLGRRLENTWDALRNEFSGDVEAAEQVESYGPQRFETHSQMPIINPNLNRLREEYEKKNPGIWEAIKNEFSGSAQASEIPINNITSSSILHEKKPFQYDYDTADAFTADEMATQPIDELTEDSSGIWEALKMAGRVINPFKKGINPLGFINPLSKLNFRNSNLYRGVTQPIGSYSPAQLNQMNALGGYYSEPARNQRRTEKRIENMLARRAQGKSYSAKNLKTLSGGQYNFGGGQQGSHQTPTRSAPAGVTTSSGMHGGRHYNTGGLATMFQRR